MDDEIIPMKVSIYAGKGIAIAGRFALMKKAESR